MTPFAIFLVTLTIAAVAAWAIGTDPRFLVGQTAALVLTFRFAQLVERDDAPR